MPAFKKGYGKFITLLSRNECYIVCLKVFWFGFFRLRNVLYN